MPEPTSLVDVQRIQANGTVLHAETRGSGPPVLLVAGAGGDAAELGGVAATLADAFTVTTYDRRGNSRSPRPAGWAQTSLAEQADDAAALLSALGQQPAVVVGTSAGGSIALELALRHPEAVRAAIVHEPPILAGTTNPQAVTAAMEALIGQGMAAGGPPAAMELFLRWAAGDAGFEAVDPTDRDRYVGNGEVFFGVEMAPIMAYAPSLQAIADAQVPIVAAASHDSRDAASRHHFLYQAAAWLARQVDADLVEVPGGHMAYLTEPVAVAESLRPLLRELQLNCPPDEASTGPAGPWPPITPTSGATQTRPKVGNTLLLARRKSRRLPSGCGARRAVLMDGMRCWLGRRRRRKACGGANRGPRRRTAPG
jgi:pimeloyl-ACP methyl ester carboxylesterase